MTLRNQCAAVKSWVQNLVLQEWSPAHFPRARNVIRICQPQPREKLVSSPPLVAACILLHLCPHHIQAALRPEISKHAVCRQIKYRNNPYQYMVTAGRISSVYSTVTLRRIEGPFGVHEVVSLLSGKVKVGFSLPSTVGLQVVAQLPGPCEPCTWATTQLRCIHVSLKAIMKKTRPYILERGKKNRRGHRTHKTDLDPVYEESRIGRR